MTMLLSEYFSLCKFAHCEPQTPYHPLLTGSIFVPMQNPDDYGFIAHFEDRVFICIRGTEGVGAWWNNFKPFPLWRNLIHSGMYDASTYYIDPIRQYLRNNVPEKTVIDFIGASRGAAVSKILRWEIGRHERWICNAIGFGEPMHGTDQYKWEHTKIAGKCMRVTNGYDLVATTSFKSFGGCHCTDNNIWLPQSKWHDYTIMTRIWDHTYPQYDKAIAKYERMINNA